MLIKMYTILILIFTGAILYETAAETLKTTEKQTTELKNRGNNLFNQFLGAINDTVKIVTENNDTGALISLNHTIAALRQLLTETGENETADGITEGIIAGSKDKSPQNASDVKEHALRFHFYPGSITSDRDKKLKLDLSEIVDLLNRKEGYDSLKDKKRKLKAKMDIEQKLAAWIVKEKLKKIVS